MLTGSGLAHPLSEHGRQAGDSQSQKARGNLGLRDGILYQTVSRLSVANQVFLGSWMVDICQEGHSQRSAPQRIHMAHLRCHSCCAPRKPSDWDGDKMHRPTCRVCTCKTPGHLSCLYLGRAEYTGPTESVPLWSTREPEPERLRPGKCTQTRARLREFPCRETCSLSSVDRKSTHTVSGGKPSVSQRLRALPTHTSDICSQGSLLPTGQLNK